MIVEQIKIFEVDDGIYEILKTLNSKGYETEYSCQGHVETDDIGYVLFSVMSSYDISNVGFEAPKGWRWRKPEYDLRLGLYMEKETDVETGNCISLTKNVIENRLKTLKEWVNELPNRGTPYNYYLGLEEVKNYIR